MRQSQLFTKTLKNPPAEEAVNAKLLTQAGFIRKMSSGVYSFLPLGFRVLQKINTIIREEMNAIGAEEVLFPALVAKEYWEKTKRWGLGVGYEFKTPAGEEVGLGWSHEEIAASLAANFIESYRDLPKGVYQIQTKFRAEARAKSGLLRGREFSMKDLYSFHADKADLDRYYAVVIEAYEKILKRLSLPYKIVEAAGGAFTKEFTHEFQVLSPVGEDTIYYCEKCAFAQNKEIAEGKDKAPCPQCGGKVTVGTGIEVANVFRLGTKYSEAFNVGYTNEKGERQTVLMGSYGIGPSRSLATIVEVHHDDKGMIWPASVAPFNFHLLVLGDKAETKKRADEVYAVLTKEGCEVLYDDRAATNGEKFSDADLIGIPMRLVVSEKTAGKIEVKRRTEKQTKLMDINEVLTIKN